MESDRAGLVHEVLDLQARLYRQLRPAREWLEVDLTMPQFKVLLLLNSLETASMSQLAASLGVTLPTVTGIVDRLVERGLLVREESPHDRRVVVCRLTARGQQMAGRMQAANRSRMAQMVSTLDSAQLRTVIAAFDLLLTAARDEEAGAASEALAGTAAR